MKTLESRLNELERTLSTDSGQELPPFIVVSKYTEDESKKEDDITLIPEISDAFRKYQIEHQAEYPILKGLNYLQFAELLKTRGQVIHIRFRDFRKEATV